MSCRAAVCGAVHRFRGERNARRRFPAGTFHRRGENRAAGRRFAAGGNTAKRPSAPVLSARPLLWRGEQATAGCRIPVAGAVAVGVLRVTASGAGSAFEAARRRTDRPGMPGFARHFCTVRRRTRRLFRDGAGAPASAPEPADGMPRACAGARLCEPGGAAQTRDSKAEKKR